MWSMSVRRTDHNRRSSSAPLERRRQSPMASLEGVVEPFGHDLVGVVIFECADIFQMHRAVNEHLRQSQDVVAGTAAAVGPGAGKARSIFTAWFNCLPKRSIRINPDRRGGRSSVRSNFSYIAFVPSVLHCCRSMRNIVANGECVRSICSHLDNSPWFP
jgi:hypothetical protein